MYTTILAHCLLFSSHESLASFRVSLPGLIIIDCCNCMLLGSICFIPPRILFMIDLTIGFRQTADKGVSMHA